MGIPDHLLPHSVVLVRPSSSTDAYGNTVYAYAGSATRTTIAAWLQQDKRTEPRTDGRDPLEQVWLIMTNHEDITGLDRIEYDSIVYEVEGPPEKVYTPAGVHHVEATLRVVAG